MSGFGFLKALTNTLPSITAKCSHLCFWCSNCTKTYCLLFISSANMINILKLLMFSTALCIYGHRGLFALSRTVYGARTT